MQKNVKERQEKEKEVRSYVKDNMKDLGRILLVVLMFVVIGLNYHKLTNVDIRQLLSQAGSPAKSILVVFLVYVAKGVTMVVPAAVVNIAVGMSFAKWEALLLNLGGSVIELVIAYAIGVFAGGDYIRDSINKTKYGKKFLALDPKKTDLAMFVVRLLPIFPIDLFSLFYGNIKYSKWRYMLISLAGILPRMVLFTILGDAAYKYLPTVTAGQAIIILAVIVACYVVYKVWKDIHDRHHPKKTEDEDNEEDDDGTDAGAGAGAGVDSAAKIADSTSAAKLPDVKAGAGGADSADSAPGGTPGTPDGLPKGN